jgi:Bifunctional DNA primase/polymerase, N-terminal/Primase C terminal 2 (PriCT-2)
MLLSIMLAAAGKSSLPHQEKRSPTNPPNTVLGRPWGKTKDPQEIQRDWVRWPDANVGVATGLKSGFWVVEADTLKGHGVDGIASLKQLEAKYGTLPETLMAESPSGSQHRYFKWPANVIIRNSASKIAPGVDVRGDGGMVIAPPSVKPGKGTYRWLNVHDLADAPKWLVELASEPGDVKQAPNKKLEADDIAALAAAVDVIPNEINGWEDWNTALMAIWAATGGSEEGFEIADRWCAKWKGYDAKNTRQRWEAISKSPPNRIGAGTIFYLAEKASPGWRAALEPITRDDFVAYLPAHNYIFLPTREPWPASSVDSQIPPVPKLDKNGKGVLDKKGKPLLMQAHTWLDKHQPVQQMTWAPGLLVLIHDKLVADGGWIDRQGATCLNLYRPPTIKRGNGAEAKPWRDLVERVYPDDHTHIVKFLPHRAQRPGEKINHCLVLGGVPGIGKDTILEPVKRAIGPWNFSEVAPGDLFKPFNGYLKSVILRVSEARDLGDVNRYNFYHHTKTLMAAPPDVLRCNEKFLREHSVFNGDRCDHYDQPQDRRHLSARGRPPALSGLEPCHQGVLP